jgi:mono/diheme cytochrome c family protein
MRISDRILAPLMAITLGFGSIASARAGERRLMPADVPGAYAQECASCHTAYPPGMLPARSWQRVMSGLDTHYGTDASLDVATTRQIGRWLLAHAGTYKRVSGEPPQDRITRSAWFDRKHRKVDLAVWTLPSVKTAASCSACHTGADQGNYDDDDLRLPRGLDARYRRAWND